MSGRCGICVQGFPVTMVSDDHLSCLRPAGHDGPHLVRNWLDRIYCWVPDDESEDPEDFIYWEVEVSEAVALVSASKPSAPDQGEIVVAGGTGTEAGIG